MYQERIFEIYEAVTPQSSLAPHHIVLNDEPNEIDGMVEPTLYRSRKSS